MSGSLKIISFVISNYFLKRKGSINSVLSEAMGVQGNELMQLMGSYLISKNALKAMLDIIKKEFKWIEVNYLFLGFVQTKFINVFDRRFLQIVSRKKKILKPQDAAKLIIKRNLNMSIDLHTLPWLVNNKNEKIRKEKYFKI